MSVFRRIARVSLGRGRNLRGLSQLTTASTTSVAATAAVTATANHPLARPAAAKCMSTASTSASASTSGGSHLTTLAKENPYKDVVRYEFKNRKWNLQHVDFYSEALAVGLLENGLQPGDVVLSWLPAHFSESVSVEYTIFIRRDFIFLAFWSN